MAACAALLSLMTTLNNIQIHPRVSTFFDHRQIQSLHQISNSLLHFLETSNSHGGSRGKVVLERRIVSTAHAAEDVIESHVVKQILAENAPQKKNFEANNLIGRFTGKLTFCARYISGSFIDLEKEIDHMNSVKEAVMEFRGKMQLQDEQSSHSMFAASTKPATMKKDFVVGFDEKVIEIMERLTRQDPDLQVAPIVGMGGIGKTTLARNVYDNLFIAESFDIRAWVTVSQDYSLKYVFFELLSCIKDRNMNVSIGDIDVETDLETEDHQLGLKLYQILWGRRYLIVLDDIWSLEAWDKIKCFFPNNGDRSRVVITTRMSSVATQLSSSSFEMNFLDEDQSWELFCGNVFQEKCCPPELEEIGKIIVRECKGLPLSIVVIGGLLRNSTSTLGYWENFARDLNSILVSSNDAHCLNILSLSYNQLSAHLKPCFLYMGIFREDEKILASKLIQLLVAEGFLKPKEGQTLEEVVDDCLNDLVDRNLILVDSWRWNGRVKYCKMHDLVREVCLNIGAREKFFHMRTLHIPAGINKERCIVFGDSIPKKKRWWLKVFDDKPLPAASLARTFLCDYEGLLPCKFRFLRVLTRARFDFHEDICQHINLRYLNWSLSQKHFHPQPPSSLSLLWNVQTLIFEGGYIHVVAPSEIWCMRQLRHLKFSTIGLPDPPPPSDDEVLLPNLNTLSNAYNFSFTEDVCKRIPNIKKLGIVYQDFMRRECEKKCCYNLGHLHKLQSLYCRFYEPKRGEFLQSLVLPNSLRKLSLHHCYLHWEDLNAIGLSLPHLEVLKLFWDAAVGDEWDCAEGAFPRLKLLRIESRDHLMKWTAESFECFPVLEKLYLQDLKKLEKIPPGIGEIQSLEILHVDWCSLSASISAIEILEEQLNLGNEEIRVKVGLQCYIEEKQSFMEKVELNDFTAKNLELDIRAYSRYDL